MHRLPCYDAKPGLCPWSAVTLWGNFFRPLGLGVRRRKPGGRKRIIEEKLRKRRVESVKLESAAAGG